jgi:hypothetical protein
MTPLSLDLRAAWRRIRFAPGPAIGVVATLGLGIAAVVTTQAVLQAVVLAPLPYPDPQELVWLSEIDPQGQPVTVSQPNGRRQGSEASAYGSAASIPSSRRFPVPGGRESRQGGRSRSGWRPWGTAPSTATAALTAGTSHSARRAATRLRARFPESPTSAAGAARSRARSSRR